MNELQFLEEQQVNPLLIVKQRNFGRSIRWRRRRETVW